MKPTKHILLLAALLLGSIAATAQNEEPIDIANNADAMLYTNAKCTNTSYGDQFAGWHVLFDNDPSTFFHSEYSNRDSDDGLDHYLRVDLGEGSKVNAFSFTYTVRGSIPYNGNYSPKTMIVEGSNTAYGTYTELVSLNNLPNTGAAVYKSPVIRNGTAYRYIRFRVTETYTNSKVQGHSYFFMAEFGMMRVRIEGTCGDNLSWKLTDDNELIIEGTGKMYDYPYDGAPWYEYRESIQTITMGEGVTSIGNQAFYDCSSLTAITIPEGVTSIGNVAFRGCSSLTSINIPEGVTWIGNSAFYDCTSLTAITIPEGVTSIENWAFYGCSSLTSITIPESVTSIGDQAFYNCSSLTSITIPEGVTSIGDFAFSSCSSLTAITIPEGVTSIGSGAFSGCSSLTAITIPEGVTSIGSRAFSGCSSLTAITIPESVTSIGYEAFYNCKNLTAITIPEGVTSIGDQAFYNCSSLTSITIPEGVTSIGEYAFGYCSGLTTIVVEEGNNVYDSRGGCNAIIETNSNTLIQGCATTIIPESVTSIGEGAFYGCRSLTSITIPEGVTSIGNSAFSNCDGLTSITIPESVTSIGNGAFSSCSSLTAITIPEGVTSIGSSAFSGCTGELTLNCNIPSVASGASAPFNNSSFSKITIGEKVTSIGDNAFYDCSSLTSITIPSSITYVGNNAFYQCTNLSEVHIQSIEAWCNITFGNRNTQQATPLFHAHKLFLNGELVTHVDIPNTITEIKKYVFKDYSYLNSVTIPNSVVSIQRYAFEDCVRLSSLVIPSTVTTIEEGAFFGCSSLTSVTCEATTPPTIGGSQAFYNVDKSIPVYVPTGSVEAYQSAAYWNEFANIKGVVSSGTCGDNLTWKLTEEYELVIEGTGDMYDYSSASAPWYEYRESIQTITMGEGVTSIGDYAFYDCSILTAINIPGNVIWIGGNAFENCGNLISITIPEGEIEICVDAFLNTGWYNEQEEGWLYLSDWFIGYKGEIPTNTDLIIREGTKGVVRQLFFSNESRNNIKSVTIPSSVIHICLGSFHMCDGIESLKVAEFNQYYDSRNDCNAIIRTSDNTLIQGCPVTIIPDDITAIDVFSFAGLKELTSIYIPANVKSLGLFAFSQCENLTTITCHALIPPICNGDVFSFDKSNANLYVPSNSVEVYKSAEHWNEFTNIQPILIASGTCGDNLTWRLTEEGELIIEGTGAMYDFSSDSAPWYEYRESIKAVTINEGATSIGVYAFYGCSSLASITIPESVTSIGNYAFNGCSSLTSITIPESVTSIGHEAFYGCSNLTTITIPESVTEIGSWPLASCSRLSSIVVDAGNLFYDSRKNCNAIIKTSSNTLIAGCASTVIPEGVTSIHWNAFKNCSSLTSINIPASVTEIGHAAFEGCSSLTSINIPASVTSIGSSAFRYCI